MTAKELLERYNLLAETPLKGWKGSKAELENRIKKLEKLDPDYVLLTKYTAPSTKNGEAVVEPTAKSNGTVTVADLARETGQDPKVARAKMRRIYADMYKDLPKAVNKKRWVFAAKDRSKILALINVVVDSQNMETIWGPKEEK